MNFVSVDPIGRGHSAADSARQPFSGRDIGHVVLQHREFVAAEARNEIVVAQHSLDTVRDRLKQSIAEQVA